MALTEEQQRLREGRLTASAVGVLMRGDPEEILNLWRYMIGDPGYVEPNWDEVWAIRLGELTEDLNLDWYELQTGRTLTRRREVMICPDATWAAATLDGWDEAIPGPVEAKHVGGFEKRAVIIRRYQAQCHWQMRCGGTKSAHPKNCVLSIIEGAKPPVRILLTWNDAYGAELWDRAERFMRCVSDLVPPVEMPPIEAPVPAVRTVDMRESNMWAEMAARWLNTRDFARDFAAAEKELKALVPADAARCLGHGIMIARDRAGRLSIKTSNDESTV